MDCDPVGSLLAEWALGLPIAKEFYLSQVINVTSRNLMAILSLERATGKTLMTEDVGDEKTPRTCQKMLRSLFAINDR